MNNLYEQFDCNSKEELYEKVKNNDAQVQALLDFLEYAKADIKTKNKAITSPNILVDYIKSTILPTKDAGTFVFVDTKNHPVLLKRSRLSRRNDLKDTIKEGLISGGTRAFLGFNTDTANKKMEEIESLFEQVGIKIVDTIGYNKDKDHFTSKTAGNSFYNSNSLELVSDGNSEYLKEDFSVKEKYIDFTSHFATSELLGLNVIDNVENIKESLKIGFQHHHQEILGILVYDSDEKIILAEELFKGTTDASLVDLKIITKNLLQLEDAQGMAIFHNHPSGNPIPSREDIIMTERVARLCDILDVELLDHFIIGKEKTLSFSQDVESFQSENYRYQDKASNMKNVSENTSYYGENNKIEAIKIGDVVKTSLSDSTMVLDVRGNNALLFNGRQFIEAYGVQSNNDKVFWGQGHYYDTIPSKIFDDNRKGYEDIKDNINDMINSNYQDFVKALISIEKGIEDEDTLEELYDRFMDNDGINLINDYFDDVMYDLEHENMVGEVGRVREDSKKPKSILGELKKNKEKEDKEIKRSKETAIVSL